MPGTSLPVILSALSTSLGQCLSMKVEMGAAVYSAFVADGYFLENIGN